MIKIIISIFISAVFLYFSLQGIEFNNIIIRLTDVRYIFLFPAVALSILVLILRSIRWAAILSPVERINQRILFPITCIGFMGIAVIPLRIGELIRPYLVSTNSRIPMSSALATIFVERILDSFVLIGMIVIVIFYADFPPLVVKSGYFLLATFIVMLLFMYLFYFKTRATINFLGFFVGKLSQKLRTVAERLVLTFVEGFKVIAAPKELFQTIFLSISIWVVSGLVIYSLFFFSNFQLPLVSAFAVLVITVLGISIPAAPGFLGTFQFSCIFALSLFYISRPDALSFSVVYYFAGIGINVIAGLIFLPFYKISFQEMKKSFSMNSIP